MSADPIANRPLTRQALIDGGWERYEDEWWRHPDLPGWTVTPHGTPVLLLGDDATTAAAIETLTPTPTPEPDDGDDGDDEWREGRWTRVEPATMGYVCTHPDHDAWSTPAAWMLYTGDQWAGQAACAEHLPAGLTPDGAP